MRLVLVATFCCALYCTQPARAEPLPVPETATLAYHLSTNAVARTNGIAGTYDDWLEYSVPVWTNADRLTKPTWSTRFWLKGVHGLSATPIGFSNVMGGQGLLTMVSPRHYICAVHMHPESRMIAFLATNNAIYWRTTLQRMDVTNDTAVGILNADLPAAVGYLPVLPPNFADYLPASSYVQGLGMNQDFRVFSQPMSFPTYLPVVMWNNSATIPFGLPPRWSVALRGGDSSNPARLLIGNQLVLVTHNTGAGGGFNYAFQIEAINRAMHELSVKHHAQPEYQLTLFSLTNWPAIRN
jgi:hypothetical protein